MPRFPVQPRRALNRMGLAILIGVMSGLAAAVFMWLIDFFQNVFFGYILSSSVRYLEIFP